MFTNPSLRRTVMYMHHRVFDSLKDPRHIGGPQEGRTSLTGFHAKNSLLCGHLSRSHSRWGRGSDRLIASWTSASVRRCSAPVQACCLEGYAGDERSSSRAPAGGGALWTEAASSPAKCRRRPPASILRLCSSLFSASPTFISGGRSRYHIPGPRRIPGRLCVCDPLPCSCRPALLPLPASHCGHVGRQQIRQPPGCHNARRSTSPAMFACLRRP
jgi:hypothetical protein